MSSGALPTPLTAFVGRSDELASIAGALARHRVVTLAGLETPRAHYPAEF